MQPTLVFLSGKRTPFGANGGKLRDVSPAQLGVNAAKAALEQARVSPSQIDHVIFGSVLHSAPDSIYIPRHIGLHCGVPEHIAALGVNRLCGTGFQVIVEAYQQMAVGDSEVALVGGVENMSMAPYVLRGVRWGMKMGHAQTYDVMTEALFDTYAGAPMAITAETLAEKYSITREAADQFALRSQMNYKAALQAGYFRDEVVPCEVPGRGGVVQKVEQDEHPRGDVSLESMGRLKPMFKKDGVVTAGNASGIVDGAAALVVSTEERARREGWAPLGKLVAYGISGCDPKIMGIGPVPAIREVLKRTGMKLEQMDLIEVNEAFAPQTMAVERELQIPREKLNVNGGAIAVGHPLAASGSRIILHLLYELKRRKKRFGLGSACIGGGQGIALIVEAC